MMREEIKQQAIVLRQNGETLKAIAEQLQVSVSAIWEYTRGVDPVTRLNTKAELYNTVAQLHAQRLKWVEIDRQLDLTPGTSGRVGRKLGLPTIPSRCRGLSAEVYQQVISLRRQGYKRKEIAQSLGLSLNKVSYTVQGVPRGESEVEKEIKRLHLDGVPQVKIAEKVGLKASSVHATVKRLGLPKNRQYEDLSGKKFDAWLVLSLIDDANVNKILWLCRCLDCGKEKPVIHNNLMKRATKRCRSCSAKAWQRRKREEAA